MLMLFYVGSEYQKQQKLVSSERYFFGIDTAINVFLLKLSILFMLQQKSRGLFL